MLTLYFAPGSSSMAAHIALREVGAEFGTPAWIGRIFLVDHLLAFEITSIVLLVAAVGGVILGSHTRRLDPGHIDAEAARDRRPDVELVP